MARLFHKIRNRLLQDRRFRNYLLYAIGEIVLVVIGILIALQINTWSQQREQNREEKPFLLRGNSSTSWCNNRRCCRG